MVTQNFSISVILKSTIASILIICSSQIVVGQSCDCTDSSVVSFDQNGNIFLELSDVFDGSTATCQFDSLQLRTNFFDCSDGSGPKNISVYRFMNQQFFDSCVATVTIDADCILCFDLNANGMADVSEDINGDGTVDGQDCCWDQDQNQFSSPFEDINGDGVFDSRDCDTLSVFATIDTLFGTQDVITFMDPCSCDDVLNCDIGGTTYFHDFMKIPATGAISSGLDIRVSSSTGFFVDVSCNGGTLAIPLFGTAGTQFTEIAPGEYELEFWRPSGTTPTLTVISGGASFTAPSSAFEPICFQEECMVVEPIPTMGEWGLISLGLLLLIVGVTSVKSREIALG